MTTIKLKNGSGAPTAGDLVQGEPALDLTNKRLYTENASGTVIEVGTNPTSITTGDITATGTATFANLATSGDVTFGDNDKAIFGAGSDLQIYHDGTNSYIVNTTNDLIIGEDTRVRIKTPSLLVNNAADTENLLTATENGAVTAYYDGAAKLATTSTGIDVTGTAVTDGLTVDASTAVVQASNAGGTTSFEISNTNGVSTANNKSALYLSATGAEANAARIESDFTGSVGANHAQDLKFYYVSTGSSPVLGQKIANNGDISFHNSAGTSQDLFWDASTSRLGLGTTLPSSSLHVSSTASSPALFERTGSTGAYIGLKDSSGSLVYLGDNNGTFEVQTAGSSYATKLAVTSAGNVGVGTSSPRYNLAVSGNNATAIGIALDNASGSGTADISILGAGYASHQAGAGEVWFYSPDNINIGGATGNTNNIKFLANNNINMFIEGSSGNVGIGTQSPRAQAEVYDGGVSAAFSASNASTWRVMQVRNNIELATGTAAGIALGGDGSADTATAGIVGISDNSTGGVCQLAFLTSSGNSTAEAMRIDSSGNLLVGTSSNLGTGSEGVEIRGDYGGIITARNTASTAGHHTFINSNGTVGLISTTGTSTNYGVSSDQRLKDNIVDAPSASDDIDAIQVRSFDWKADGSHQKYGMVAQELQGVAPEAVIGDADSEEMMAVDYSKLVPMLVKEIQSLRARVAQLEND